MKAYRKINYKFKGIKGTILIGETITDEQEIKRICMKDYLEKKSNEIEILEEEN